jgi:CHASE2 domain-containing sensor protein
MDSDRFLTNLSYGIMKFGLIVFIFPFFWEYIRDPGLDQAATSASLSIFLSVAFIALSFAIAVMSKENFNIFGFALILLASISMFFYILFKNGWHDGMAPYFLLITISVYFMTKLNRSR